MLSSVATSVSSVLPGEQGGNPPVLLPKQGAQAVSPGAPSAATR